MADNNYEIDVTLEETFGTGVRSVEQTATSAESGGMNEITVTLTNDQENKFYIMNGLAGKDGRDGGFPVAVGEASLMTDTSKIYLYVGIEEGYTQNHLYYWDGEAWHDYGTYGAPADYLRSASVTHEQGLDQLGNTTYTADTLTIEGNADGSPAETEFVQKLYYSAGENVDGALTQKATSEAIESAQYLPIVNHPNSPVGSTDLSVELQQNVMNVIGGVGYAFTTITMTLATKKAGRVNRYFGRFTTGGNAFAVTWPTGVTVPSALSYKTQTTYDFVIEDSILHVWEDGNAVGDVLDATATANAVSTWLTNHPEATTTVADGSITTAKLASGVIDQTLTLSGVAADSAKVGQELSDLKSEISQGGLKDSIKSALIGLADAVAYKNSEIGASARQALYDALYEVGILSIRAIFAQGSNVVYTHDSLDSLKQYLTVIVNYDNDTSAGTTTYALSGELETGVSIITVSYGGKSTTFNVNVTEGVPSTYTVYDYIQLNGTADSIAAAPARRIALNAQQDLDSLSLRVKLKLLDAVTNGNMIMGVRTSSAYADSYALYVSKPADQPTIQFVARSKYQSCVKTVNNNEVFTFEFKNSSSSPSYMSINGEDEEFAWETPHPNPNGMTLFGNATAGSTANLNIRNYIQIGEIELTDLNGDSAGHYFPVVRNSDNVIGMYDLVTETLYTASTTSYAINGGSQSYYKVGNWE